MFHGNARSYQPPIEHLESGETIDEFLDQFPGVSREQALAALELSKQSLLTQYEVAA
jgi:uncharacterized protein (DUF433 family)